MKSVVLLAGALVITGIAGAQALTQDTHAENDASATSAASQSATHSTADHKSAKAEKFVMDTVQSPLKDLNLVKDKIPEALIDAKKNAYAVPLQAACPSLHAEILQLDALLGPDLDASDTADNSTAAERGAKLAGKEAARVITGAVNDLVPYRGWVRKLSGAERHSEEVAAAIAAGSARRAFLKGYSAGMGCKTVVEAKN